MLYGTPDGVNEIVMASTVETQSDFEVEPPVDTFSLCKPTEKKLAHSLSEKKCCCVLCLLLSYCDGVLRYDVWPVACGLCDVFVDICWAVWHLVCCVCCLVCRCDVLSVQC